MQTSPRLQGPSKGASPIVHFRKTSPALKMQKQELDSESESSIEIQVFDAESSLKNPSLSPALNIAERAKLEHDKSVQKLEALRQQVSNQI